MRRFDAKFVMAVTLAVASAGFVAACGADDTNQSTDPVLVRSGAIKGREWEVWAYRNSTGQLCIELKSDIDNDVGDGACGFDDSPTDGRTLEWQPEDGPGLIVGPAPISVSKVRISGANIKERVVDTTPLPESAGSGCLFVAEIPEGSAGKIEAALFDASGKEVLPQDF